MKSDEGSRGRNNKEEKTFILLTKTQAQFQQGTGTISCKTGIRGETQITSQRTPERISSLLMLLFSDSTNARLGTRYNLYDIWTCHKQPAYKLRTKNIENEPSS